MTREALTVKADLGQPALVDFRQVYLLYLRQQVIFPNERIVFLGQLDALLQRHLGKQRETAQQ